MSKVQSILLTVALFSSTSVCAIDIAIPDLGALKDMTDTVKNAPSTALGFDTGKASTGEINGDPNTFSGQKTPWEISDEFSHIKTDMSGEVMDCLEYAVVGMCFSYRVTMFGINFYENFVVEHYSRDTHVEVTKKLPQVDKLSLSTKVSEDAPTGIGVGGLVNNTATSLWKGLNYNGSGLSSNGVVDALEMGSSEMTTDYNNGHSYTYSDAMVMGNPELTMFNSTVGSIYGTVGWCDSSNTPYFLYFHSAMDQFSWRWLATTETVLLGLYSAQDLSWNGVGSGFGSVMPRSGYVVNNSRFKSSVISALRAVSVAGDNRGQFSGIAGAHLYFPMNEFANNTWTRNEYRTPQNAGFFKLEMIYPFEGKKCTRYKNLSYQDELDLEKKFNTQNKAQSAAFKVYRPFRCCKRKGNHIATVVSGSKLGGANQMGSPNK